MLMLKGLSEPHENIPLAERNPWLSVPKSNFCQTYQIPKPTPVRLLFSTEFHGFRPGLPSQLMSGTGRVCRLLDATNVRRTATTHFAIYLTRRPPPRTSSPYQCIRHQGKLWRNGSPYSWEGHGGGGKKGGLSD